MGERRNMWSCRRVVCRWGVESVDSEKQKAESISLFHIFASRNHSIIMQKGYSFTKAFGSFQSGGTVDKCPMRAVLIHKESSFVFFWERNMWPSGNKRTPYSCLT